MQAALEKELEETEKAATNGDAEMAGAEETPADAEADNASEAGSEDLEQESSDDDDDEDEEEGGENEGDEDTEMADGDDKPATTNGEAESAAESKPDLKKQDPEVMAH
jgi:histone chaperone ASF1